MSYQRLLDKVEGSTSGGAEGLHDCFRPLFGKEVRRRDQLEPLAELNAWIEKSVRLDPHTEDAKVSAARFEKRPPPCPLRIFLMADLEPDVRGPL